MRASAKILTEDAVFRRELSSVAIEASLIVSEIRSEELRSVWTRKLEENLAQQTPNLLHGAASTLDGETMRKTRLWKIAKRFPKGSLLHAHLAGMIDIEWLVETALDTAGMCIFSSQSMSTAEAREAGDVIFQFSASKTEAFRRQSSKKTLWATAYEARELIPLRVAASTFPKGGLQGFVAWMRRKCTIGQDNEENQRLGPSALLQKFGRCFPIIDSLLFYEPILRLALKRIFEALVEDRVMYAEFRVVFVTPFYGVGRDVPDGNYLGFVGVFREEIKRFKSANEDGRFWGARVIWTIRRKSSLQKVAAGMKDCIFAKKTFPDMIAGFDFAGQESAGKSLESLTPSLIWFEEECLKERLEIPFLFHAGECLSDGDETDKNLFDALLLQSRRIGHALSLFKHPVLMQMAIDNKVLIESCPISNQALRLTNSIQPHPLPALFAHGVPVALGNDDPSIFGEREIGLTNDFWQVLQAFENVGLGGLAHMAENSVRWSCFEDQNLQSWHADIDCRATNSLKASRLKLWSDEFAGFCLWITHTFKNADE